MKNANKSSLTVDNNLETSKNPEIEQGDVLMLESRYSDAKPVMVVQVDCDEYMLIGVGSANRVIGKRFEGRFTAEDVEDGSLQTVRDHFKSDQVVVGLDRK